MRAVGVRGVCGQGTRPGPKDPIRRVDRFASLRACARTRRRGPLPVPPWPAAGARCWAWSGRVRGSGGGQQPQPGGQLLGCRRGARVRDRQRRRRRAVAGDSRVGQGRGGCLGQVGYRPGGATSGSHAACVAYCSRRAAGRVPARGAAQRAQRAAADDQHVPARDAPDGAAAGAGPGPAGAGRDARGGDRRRLRQYGPVPVPVPPPFTPPRPPPTIRGPDAGWAPGRAGRARAVRLRRGAGPCRGGVSL